MQDDTELLVFLNSAFEAGLEVRQQQDWIAELDRRAGGPEPELRGALMRARAAAVRACAQELRTVQRVEQFLDQIQPQRLRMVLRLRHVRGLSWNALRREVQRYGLYYSDRQLRRVYQKALDAARVRWAQTRREETICPKTNTQKS